jgi:hypothetical protein
MGWSMPARIAGDCGNRERANGSPSRASVKNTKSGAMAQFAPSWVRYFSELAFTLAGGFRLNDFLKLVIALFLSPFKA